MALASRALLEYLLEQLKDEKSSFSRYYHRLIVKFTLNNLALPEKKNFVDSLEKNGPDQALADALSVIGNFEEKFREFLRQNLEQLISKVQNNE